MAASFEGMNLVDEAQLQYDELEASFFQALKGSSVSFPCAGPDIPQKKICHGSANWEEMSPAMILTLFSMSTLNRIATLY